MKVYRLWYWSTGWDRENDIGEFFLKKEDADKEAENRNPCKYGHWFVEKICVVE